jgi:hypothetical protein
MAFERAILEQNRLVRPAREFFPILLYAAYQMPPGTIRCLYARLLA